MTSGSMDSSGTDVPSVAIRWLVLNSTFADADLAVLSNVSRAWRDIVAECIVEAALGNDDDDDDKPKLEISRLLVPSWIREKSRSTSLTLEDNDHETYCLAWFHPLGMKYKTLIPKNAREADEGAKVLCRWLGYDEAADVFKPFGYSPSLLQKLMDKVQSNDSANSNKFPPFPTHQTLSKPPSAAVRGATEAQPEGYWEYLEAQTAEEKMKIFTSEKPLRQSELDRLVLPKVLMKVDEEETRMTALERKGRSKFQRRLPFCQFLNIDRNHAVRLQTKPFKKPVFTPITVFCVAIATEDGCFFSGLNEELEMGHMYPTEENEELCDDRSPICLNAGYRAGRAGRAGRAPRKNKSESEDNYLDLMKNACYLDGGSESDDGDSENDYSEGGDVTNAISGQLGPGLWHCYSAVFDGNQSIIRIDGEEESTTCASKIPASFRACLDGITIGSDHSFAMSLCFGQGSDGEGDGAIAELAFFKGRLPTSDIASVESHLMEKHNIKVPNKTKAERVKDDYMLRLAHKLMDQTPAQARRTRGQKKTISVPLGCMTKLRQVAWAQHDKVTGGRRKIQRIGCKVRKGSDSDW